MKRPKESGHRRQTSKVRKRAVVGLILLLSVGAVFLYAGLLDKSTFKSMLSSWIGFNLKSPRSLPRSPFPCPRAHKNLSCHSPPRLPPSPLNHATPQPSCPEYFRWIHEDLRPWKDSGITEKMVESVRNSANFRLLLVNGSLYIESYSSAFQTRDTFGWWGILQMLRKYRDRLPDLDLMFNCDDIPVVKASSFYPHGKELPPPLFGYCKDDHTLDIPFPDWSFWGWLEVNIKPWMSLSRELREGNKRRKWEDRDPYAFWKGNSDVSRERRDLLKCNLSQNHDWNARLFDQDWVGETNQGFQHSNLVDQCTYRYKIYIEGRSWSVSQKYILACDSLTLQVTPNYHDFFTRGLIPLKHYWPINKESMCSSIKSAVHWGNSHKDQAQAIGRNAGNFIMEELKMDYVYDYMFHLLNEYAKLLNYKPKVPPNAVEVCVDSMMCNAQQERELKFMMDSKVNVKKIASIPCSLPPPFTPKEMGMISKRGEEAMKIVKNWEHELKGD